MAIINADYFLFNPEDALVYPRLLRTDVVDATFDWRALPKGTPLFSSFGDGKRVQRVRAQWYRVQGALFAGGNFRMTESHVRSGQRGTGAEAAGVERGPGICGHLHGISGRSRWRRCGRFRSMERTYSCRKA